MMEYKGYVASVEFDDSANVLHGRIVNSGPYPIAMFEATDVRELRREFERSVDEYLGWCEEDGVAPRKPVSGQLDVRLGSELHAAAVRAQRVRSKLASTRRSSRPFERRSRRRWVIPRRNDPRRKKIHYPLLGELRPSIQEFARIEAGPRVRPGEAWHVASKTSRRLRFNEDAKQVQGIILAGVVREVEFLACVPHHVVHVTSRSVQMGQSTDLGTAPRYRLEVSRTRSESVTMVVEGPLEDLARRTPFHHESPAAPSSPGLPQRPMSLSHESSRKLPDRRSK